MLKSYGEGAGPPGDYMHYTKGGKPGYLHERGCRTPIPSSCIVS
jgi:hypothetical protein